MFQGTEYFSATRSSCLPTSQNDEWSIPVNTYISQPISVKFIPLWHCYKHDFSGHGHLPKGCRFKYCCQTHIRWMPILWILFGVHTWNQNAHQSRILWQQMIFLGPLSTNFHLFKNCGLNYKFRKIDAHKYKWNHSTSEGAWFFSSHSWAIKPSISMYLNHPGNVKPLLDWVRYTSEYYKPSRTCERN